MKNIIKQQFVKNWTKEYESTVKANQLRDKLETAQALGKATTRLQNQINGEQYKADSALNTVATMIETGLLPEDAHKQCKEELGNLYGYVCDCYCGLYDEFKPE